MNTHRTLLNNDDPNKPTELQTEQEVEDVDPFEEQTPELFPNK